MIVDKYSKNYILKTFVIKIFVIANVLIIDLASALALDQQSNNYSINNPNMSSSSTKKKQQHHMLFLHGQFVTPECYTSKFATKLFEKLESTGDWDVDIPLSPRITKDPTPPIMIEWFPNQKVHPEWINSETHTEEDGSTTTKTYHGLKESLNWLKEYIMNKPYKYDIIAGHSNGAIMTALLAFMMEKTMTMNTSDTDTPPYLPQDKHCNGIIIFNAPNSFETERTLMKEYIARDGPMITSIPSLHVFSSTNDAWVGDGSTKMLTSHFPKPSSGKTVVIDHENGHWFPTDDKHYDQILQFMNQHTT